MLLCICKGKTLNDIEKSWAMLERAEHERERALQETLLRLESLEQLAQKFARKVTPLYSYECLCYKSPSFDRNVMELPDILLSKL